MVKYLMVFLVLAVAALFYPFRDLYVLDDPFNRHYTLVAKGFWTLDACREAAEAQHAEDYHCRERTMFGSMVNRSGEYGLVQPGYAQ